MSVPSTKRITIADVARHAGVSTATVSRVINGQGVVSPHTVARVEVAIAALDFAPHMGASELAGRRPNTIGLIFPGIGDPFLAASLQGIEDNRWGVVVTAGTSNNCLGRDRQGREAVALGQGPRFGEYGGATEIVQRAMKAVALAWTARGPQTELTAAFMAHVGASDPLD